MTTLPELPAAGPLISNFQFFRETDSMQKSALTRRAVLGGLAGLGVTGCGLSPTLDLIGQSFTGVSSKGSDGYPMSAERIRAIPYASIGVRIGNSAPAVMILATYDGENLNWASADRVILVTRQGRLVKTVGLARDLVGTQWTGSDTIIDYARGGGSVANSRVNRFIDLRPDDDFGVAIESTVRPIGTDRITILGQTFDTRVVSEKIVATKWRWSKENQFWIDQASGKIVRSRQSYCPEVEPITIEVLKPAAESNA
jgi:hypothetical protein